VTLARRRDGIVTREGSTSSGAYRRLQLALLALALAAANFARTAMSPLQEQVRSALSLTDPQIAMLQGPALALPLILASVPIGFLMDRYSRARLVAGFAVSAWMGSALTALAPNFLWLFAARSLVGVSACAVSIGVLSLVADHYAPAERGRANMVVATAEVGGASAAFAVGGALLGLLGEAGPRWPRTMLWTSAPLAMVAVLMLALRDTRRREFGPESSTLGRSLGRLWRYRATIAPLIAAKILVVTAYGAAVIWASPALSRRFAEPAERVGALMATALLIAGLLGPIAGGYVADFSQRRGGPVRTLLVLSGLALVSVPAGCFALSRSMAIASASLIAFLTLVSMIGVIEMTLTTVVIPNELRGLCLSVMVTVSLVFGIGLAPLVVSMLSGALGGPTTLALALTLVCTATGMVGSVIFWLARPLFPPKTGMTMEVK
jgi:MFS family permease